MAQEKKILVVSSEVQPYLVDSEVSSLVSECCKVISKNGYQTRIFTPKYGLINERKHRLHEVVRLSGTPITVNDFKVPLIVKVATIPDEKLQAYFIDNEEYFKRRFLYADASGKLFEDNDERAIFFAKGVINTIKSLGWIPDVIHVYGHLSLLIPLYLKEFYKDEPILSNIKVVTILSEDILSSSVFESSFVEKVSSDIEDVKIANPNDSKSILKSVLTYSNNILINEELNSKANEIIGDHPITPYNDSSFEEKLLETYS